jgi:hypothetical protein
MFYGIGPHEALFLGFLFVVLTTPILLLGGLVYLIIRLLTPRK